MFDLAIQPSHAVDHADEWNSAPTEIEREDLDVQVRIAPDDPFWHRKAIGGHYTACGHVLGGFASRDESYAGELCEDGCFTRFELARREAATEPAPRRRRRSSPP